MDEYALFFEPCQANLLRGFGQSINQNPPQRLSNGLSGKIDKKFRENQLDYPPA
jgi:hypothetical protein